jgi:hypothetical protein
MSSIKQVQDLEEQLQNYKQQLRHLQTRMMRPDRMVDMDEGVPQTMINLPEIEYRPMPRTNATIRQDFSDVRSNLRYYGRGILNVPAPYRARGAESLVTGDAVDLPQKHLADRLLTQYFDCVHSVLPVLHWPIFIAEYEKVYRSGSLLGVSNEWAAVLFGVFACGAIHAMEPNSEEEGKKYVRTSCGIINVWHDNFNLDRARAALLASIFLYEFNSKSASWVWIGSAVRVAQEIGLHIDSGPWPAVEGEMRRRVWRGLYAWDGLVALEMGKPALINDQDCDVDLPCLVAEQYITERGKTPDSQQTTSLLATIHVVRSISQLTRTLRPATISPVAFETFELHFNTCLATITAQFHPENDQEADPRFLAPVLYMHNVRLLLHRQSISPFCLGTVRSSDRLLRLHSPRHSKNPRPLRALPFNLPRLRKRPPPPPRRLLSLHPPLALHALSPLSHRIRRRPRLCAGSRFDRRRPYRQASLRTLPSLLPPYSSRPNPRQRTRSRSRSRRRNDCLRLRRYARNQRRQLGLARL